MNLFDIWLTAFIFTSLLPMDNGMGMGWTSCVFLTAWTDTIEALFCKKYFRIKLPKFRKFLWRIWIKGKVNSENYMLGKLPRTFGNLGMLFTKFNIFALPLHAIGTFIFCLCSCIIYDIIPEVWKVWVFENSNILLFYYSIFLAIVFSGFVVFFIYGMHTGPIIPGQMFPRRKIRK